MSLYYLVFFYTIVLASQSSAQLLRNLLLGNNLRGYPGLPYPYGLWSSPYSYGYGGTSGLISSGLDATLRQTYPQYGLGGSPYDYLYGTGSLITNSLSPGVVGGISDGFDASLRQKHPQYGLVGSPYAYLYGPDKIIRNGLSRDWIGGQSLLGGPYSYGYGGAGGLVSGIPESLDTGLRQIYPQYGIVRPYSYLTGAGGISDGLGYVQPQYGLVGNPYTYIYGPDKIIRNGLSRGWIGGQSLLGSPYSFGYGGAGGLVSGIPEDLDTGLRQIYPQYGIVRPYSYLTGAGGISDGLGYVQPQYGLVGNPYAYLYGPDKIIRNGLSRGWIGGQSLLGSPYSFGYGGAGGLVSGIPEDLDTCLKPRPQYGLVNPYSYLNGPGGLIGGISDGLSHVQPQYGLVSSPYSYPNGAGGLISGGLNGGAPISDFGIRKKKSRCMLVCSPSFEPDLEENGINQPGIPIGGHLSRHFHDNLGGLSPCWLPH